VSDDLPRYLKVNPGKTIFEGDVMEIVDQNGFVSYSVENGGWASDGPNSPEIWLTEGVLERFKGRYVRVTVEDLGETFR
jgi:hypothetical protein